MKTTFDATFTLTRHNETGPTRITMKMISGMPDLVTIETENSKIVELTLGETQFFRYVMAKLGNMKRYANAIDKNEDYDD